MVRINLSGTREREEECRRGNQIAAVSREARDDQVVALLRDVIKGWPPKERAALRTWLEGRSEFEKNYRFAQLLQAHQRTAVQTAELQPRVGAPSLNQLWAALNTVEPSE